MYTVYVRDRLGRLSSPRHLFSVSDAEALDKAEGLLSPDEDGEVWRNGEQVGRIHGFEPLMSYA